MQEDTQNKVPDSTVQDANGLLKQPAPKVYLTVVLIIVVCAVTLATHWKALSAEALSFDDNRYFVENFLVRNPSLESAQRFLTEVLEPSTVGGYYQPLTMISLMLDYASGGQTDSLRPFHRTSLALHVANTALIIVLLYQLFGNAWAAAGVGLLFGVHPLTVEPIPWVGERKTLLAAFFTLWCLVLYMRFIRKGSSKSYRGSITFFILALMSKPTCTPLPALMLLMDFWPLKRLRWRSILEKLPFFVVAGISAVVTYISQSRTASVIMPESYGPLRVPLVICHNIIFYLYKMIWPVNLTSHYAFPKPLGLATPMILTGVIGTCILIPLLIISLRWTRAALTGWLMFFVMVFPTMQMLQFSDVIASDKFVYLPSIGILMILAAFLSWICGIGDIRQHKRRCIAVMVIVLVLAGAESFATQRYLVCWQDTISLFSHMVKVTPRAVSPWSHLGAALGENNDLEKAKECFQEAIAIDPNSYYAYVNMGVALAGQGRFDEAESYYKQSITMFPTYADAYRNYGVMLTAQDRVDEAIALYRKALEGKLDFPCVLHTGLGTILLQMGNIDEAIYELQLSVNMKPDAITFNNLGVALSLKGRTDEAMDCHIRAVKLQPRNAEAHYDIANILRTQNKLDQAIDEYKKALNINPNYANAHCNLAVTLSQQNRPDEAIEHFTQATNIEPNNPHLLFNLADALASKGAVDEAVKHLRKVIELAPEDTEARCKLAELMLQKGQVEQAVSEYEQALKIDPNNQDAQLGLDKARDMQKGMVQPMQPAPVEAPVNP